MAEEHDVGALAAAIADRQRVFSKLSKALKSSADPKTRDPAALLATLRAALTCELDAELRARVEGVIPECERAVARTALELEAMVRDLCEKRGWRVDGQWPALYVERAVEVKFVETGQQLVVAERKTSALNIYAAEAALNRVITTLIPRGFSTRDFAGRLLRAYSVESRGDSDLVPILEVYRGLILDLQSKQFWRGARSDRFKELSLEQFRARLTKTLEDEEALPIDGRDIRLYPPIDPKESVFLYQPAEGRFGFVGRLGVSATSWRRVVSGNVELPSVAIARGMIRSLTRGTTIADGARYIHVGHGSWLAAQQELLNEVAEDGYSETKFVRGAYGTGKSHFLVVVQDIGREAGWVTSHVECKADGVQIDRFETLYPRLAIKMRVPTESGADGTGHGFGPDPIRSILDTWARRLMRNAGIRDDGISRPFDAESRLYTQLQNGLLQSNLPAPFVKGLAAYVRAKAADDFDVANAIVSWLKGGDEKAQVPKAYLHRPAPGATAAKRDYFELRPVGTGTAPETLRGLLWLIKAAGFKGLILCIDEVEELAKLRIRRRRDQALQALREHVDNAGGDAGYHHLCLYLAATPEMFESPDYFPRYDALATRIHPIGKDINWRAPVIDLDRTPLDLGELRKVALAIKRVHNVAYGVEATAALTEPMLATFVDEVMQTRFRVAKPRLLARLIVHELERVRQIGDEYEPPSDVKGRLVDLVEEDAR